MKTVPTVRLADTAEAAALSDLPEEIQLALADIVGAAREGLMAMSVAAGLAVMAAMFDAEISQVCGPKGRHDTKRPRCATAPSRLGHPGRAQGGGEPTPGSYRRRA